MSENMFNIVKNNGLTNQVLLFLLVTTTFSLVLLYIQWMQSRRHMCKLARKIPIPPNIPYNSIIGHATQFIGSTEKILKSINSFGKTPGPYSVWMGHHLMIMINTPEHMEIVLNSPKSLSKDSLYTMIESLVGKGLFSAAVPDWKRHRKIIAPTFNQRILDGFVNVFADQADIFVQQMKNKTNKTFDVFPDVAKYGLDTVCETAMGIQINAQTKESPLTSNILRCTDIIMTRLCNFMLHPDFIYNWTHLSQEEKTKSKYFRDFIDKVIEDKKAAYKENKGQTEIDEDDEIIKRKVFLECLIEASEEGNHFTNKQMRDEVATFMIAGSDTSATILAFAFLMLGMHKDIQQKVYEEVIDILGPDRQVNYTDLPKMVYIEKVLKETMRMFPIGPAVLRKVDEDLELDNYILPKGAGLIIGIMAMHYSPLYYKDPKKFDPERFNPEETAKRHKYAFIPFSGGPRNCVGMKYGMMSLKTLLASVVRRYYIETNVKKIEDIRLKQAIIIKAVDGVPIRLIARD